MSIGKNIKQLREYYRMTQVDFAEICGVSDKAVSTWENETAEPRMGVLQRISDHFNIEKSMLLKDSDTFASFVFQPEPSTNDVCVVLQDILKGLLDSECNMTFKGEEIDDITRQLLIHEIDNAISIANINLFKR